MPSSRGVREFITQRLTAAAVEIFTMFEETIMQYETEINRQRSLLNSHWTPKITEDRTDVPQQHVHKEELFLSNQQLFNQERSSSLYRHEPDFPQIKGEEEEQTFPHVGDDQGETEPAQIKEELEELCTDQDGELLVLKQETCVFMQNPLAEKGNRSEPEGDSVQHGCPAAENQDQTGTKHVDSGLNTNTTTKPNEEHQNYTCNTDSEDNSILFENMCDTNSDKKSLQCDFCGKAFGDFYKLKIHRRIHIGTKEFSCETCGKGFIQEEHLTAHKCDNIHSCKICGESYSHLSHLLYHMRSHSDEKPYSCKMCGKGFRESRYLLNHMRTHTGDMPYTCKMCNKSFKQSRYLLNHMRIHTGEKPYPCKICGRSFGQGSYLSVHMRTHTGEKPYSCGTCGKRFTQQGNLLKHMGTHTGKKS